MYLAIFFDCIKVPFLPDRPRFAGWSHIVKDSSNLTKYFFLKKKIQKKSPPTKARFAGSWYTYNLLFYIHCNPAVGKLSIYTRSFAFEWWGSGAS